jgi:DNA-directed RNA polymerase subunit H (RpoH/RPB5)
MKKILTYFVFLSILAACSSPKYAYHFDYFDYNSGKKAPGEALTKGTMSDSPLAISSDELTASLSEEVVHTPDSKEAITTPAEISVAQKEKLVEAYKALSKEEKKELKRELKREVKEAKRIKEDDGVSGTKALGHDMRYAAIFGAIGIVLLIIGGDVLGVLGAISLIVGLFFFIRWLSKQ